MPPYKVATSIIPLHVTTMTTAWQSPDDLTMMECLILVLECNAMMVFVRCMQSGRELSGKHSGELISLCSIQIERHARPKIRPRTRTAVTARSRCKRMITATTRLARRPWESYVGPRNSQLIKTDGQREIILQLPWIMCCRR
jgi:hypothetical protein